MSDNEKNLDTEDVETPVEESTAAEETADDTPEEGKVKGSYNKKLKKAEAELAETKKKLEAAEAALTEEKDKYLRMRAEYDNVRGRTAKDKDTI